jgi:superfamily II DNA or RNA helicase
MDYNQFLQAKIERSAPTGFDPPPPNPVLFPHIARVVQWGLRKGNYLGGLAVGMGKTSAQCEDAKQKQAHYGGKCLFVAPLAVSHQTILEAKKFNDIDIVYAQSQAEADLSGSNFIITNQEHIIRKKFDNHAYNILVLDEASKMLKAFRGKARNELTYQWGPVPHKTAWTATPAPNQLIEILNYAEFLGIKRTNDALTKWFDNDASKKGTEALYLKPLMEKDFWEWLASWCVVAREPADLGFSNEGHELPEVEYIYHACATDHSRAFEQTVKITKEASQRRLIPETNHSATNMWRDKRATVTERAQELAAVVEANPGENWFILTDTDYERDEVNRHLDGCTIVTGSQKQAVKEGRLLGFARGEVPRLLTKPDIAGFGLNFQYHCNHMVLVGLTHKWEIIHQVIGRIVRPLQTKKCYVHIILADSEVDILANIERKQAGYDQLQTKMTPAMKVSGVLVGAVERNDDLQDTPHNEQMLLPKWLKDQEDERIKDYA